MATNEEVVVGCAMQSITDEDERNNRHKPNGKAKEKDSTGGSNKRI
jgi:hypothetical protein